MRLTIDKQGRHRDGARSSPMGGKAPIRIRTDGKLVPALPQALGNHALSRFVERDRDTNQPHARLSTAAAIDLPKHVGVQAKLNVSQPQDECEREADDIAQSIMRQGKEGATHPRTRSKPDLSGVSGGTPATEALHSGGHPLDPSTLAFMSRSGAGDFGQVRVHSDERAADAAASINARAFTSRNHIVFGRGEYAPRTDSGRLLLAHELVHTLQQTGIGQRRNSPLMRKPAEPKVVRGLKSELLAGNEELEAVNRGESTIHLGSRGEAVLRIQLALRADNATALAERSADRRYGTETRAAVMAYQRAHGLDADGVVGSETLRSLDATANRVIKAVPEVAQMDAKEQFGISGSRPDNNVIDNFFGLLPGLSKEQTFIERKFPPTVTAAGTLYRKLSLVGSAELSPVGSFATLSKHEMTLEFEKFGTSLTFKQGKSLNDVTFSSPAVEIGKSKVAFRSNFVPPTITAVYTLPKELILGKAKLKGELRLELEFKLIPKQTPEGIPEHKKDIPSPSDWIGVGSFLIAVLLVMSGRGILFEPSIMETPMKGPALAI